ncbi:MAG: peptidylprolyl isomerase, partial [Dongiaceae bacterium]
YSIVRKLFCLIFLGFACLVAAPTTAPAQDSLRIVAIVNDDVITALDLAKRTRIIITSSGLQDTPDVRQRLAPQVLRTLIDERLRAQEVARGGVTVPDARVDARLDQLAQENNMNRADFATVLARNGVQIDWLGEQIRNEIAWSQLVQRRFRASVIVTDEDIDDAQRRILENEGKTEYLVGEIFLAVDSPEETDATQQAAERLIEQLKGGGDFGAVARQFSQSASAASGGNVGWVRPGDLAPELDAAVQRLQPGQVAGPVRSEGGFFILALRDQRRTSILTGSGTVSIREVVVPLQGGATPAEADEAIARARALTGGATSCEDIAQVAAEIGPGSSALIGNVTIGELPPALQPVAAGQPIGQPTEPVRVQDGIAVYVVCERNLPDNAGPSRADIADQLVRERLDLLARGLLRDLRRNAYVDVRG